jgi:hypothetical protein
MKLVHTAVWIMCLLAASLAWAQAADSPKYITFSVPGAQAILPTSIASDGTVAGAYTDSNGVGGGFLRSTAGRYTKFAPSGSVNTWVAAINSKLTVAGQYQDSSGAVHGFVRLVTGEITSFDAPGEGKGSSGETFPQAINAGGEIVGYYEDSNQVYHGFFRTLDGKVTAFDAPGAGNRSTEGTLTAGVSDAGEIAGRYMTDSKNADPHGFVRSPDGKFSEFNVPQTFGPYVSGINNNGTVVGSVLANSGEDGFSRTAEGKIARFARGIAQAINDPGAVVGSYVDNNYVSHGWVRSPAGKVTYFNVPGNGKLQGTVPYAINESGEITGGYLDTNGVQRGFIRR